MRANKFSDSYTIGELIIKSEGRSMKNIIYDQYRKLIRASKYRWIVIIASAAYIISPVDLLPELFTFPIGLIDDGLVATLLVTEVSAILSEKMKAKKSARSDASSNDGEKNTVDVGSSRMK